MHARRWLVRGLWLVVVFSLGVSFVGRALAMRAGVAAALAQAARTGSGTHRMPMGAGSGAKDAPAPCPGHDGQCCAPCLACCAACASVPLPADAGAASLVALAGRTTDAAARSLPAPRAGGRHFLPPSVGPPSPLVS